MNTQPLFQGDTAPSVQLSHAEQRRLLEIAERAESWFTQHLGQQPMMNHSLNDDLFIARALHEFLEPLRESLMERVRR